ncbi:MAG: cellulase family glycosylhydrolase [Fibrobacteres bacterium]|nr:cellulase family glycosylhydrolase [Fibrobacterota bacterium]
MRRLIRLALPVLAFALPGFSGNPVDIHGRLQTVGNRIIGEKSGDTVQLTGMSFFWHTWMGSYYNAKTVDWLVDDWRCSILRAAVGVDFADGGVASPGDIAGGRRLAEAVVEAANHRGVYSIIDWHSHYAPKHVADAKGFFDTMSAKYGKDPGVIFELFNEPWANVYTWKEIKAFAEEIIPVIRKNSDNLILVGTRQWSRDVDEASLDPILDPNVAYVLHFYAGSHRDTLTQRGRTALANGMPLFVSEWGTTNEDGGTIDKAVYKEPTLDWFAWMDSNKISSCNWSVQNKDEASAILKPSVSKLFGWNDSDLTESGLFVRGLIRERNTQYDFLPPPIDSSKLPGRVEAENATSKLDLTNSGPGDTDNSLFLGNSKVGSWAEYTVFNPHQKLAVMAFRVATADSAAKVTIKIDGKVWKVFSFKGTGGWGKFETVRTDSLLMRAGSQKIRLEWNGLFDLNWFEITGRIDEGGTVIPIPVDSTPVAVRVEAESFLAKNSMTLENSEDDATQSLGWTYDTSWADYEANLQPGRQVVALRAASESKGATLRIKVGGVVVTSVKVTGTSGWKKWQTFVSDSFTLAGGPTQFRLEWKDGNNQDGLVNLNWMEFRSPAKVEGVIGKPGAAPGVRWVGGALRLDLPEAAHVQVLDPAGRILAERAVSRGESVLEIPGTSRRALVRIRTPSSIRTVSAIRF